MLNSGSCTPIKTNPSPRQRSYHFLLSARVRMQLMQVYSQKSIITTLPRNCSMVRGRELIQVMPVEAKEACGCGWVASGEGGGMGTVDGMGPPDWLGTGPSGVV